MSGGCSIFTGSKTAHQLIRYKPGEKVEKGDILAQVGGIIPRVVRAPTDGKVKGIYRGQVVLETPGTKLELLAGIAGKVTEILPDRGLVIESDGALLAGCLGQRQDRCRDFADQRQRDG